ncbi:hypothetical protein ADL30_05205 [Streptomyces sp. NRRL S-1521]|nr:hypothetical protein ADL30_05205 [Streptomyces sp. NRRL S-1521]
MTQSPDTLPNTTSQPAGSTDTSEINYWRLRGHLGDPPLSGDGGNTFAEHFGRCREAGNEPNVGSRPTVLTRVWDATPAAVAAMPSGMGRASPDRWRIA